MMGTQCSARVPLFGKVVINLGRPTLLPSLRHPLHPVSKFRHPLRNEIIKFVYEENSLGLLGKTQKDINIKENKCGMFKYRELS